MAAFNWVFVNEEGNWNRRERVFDEGIIEPDFESKTYWIEIQDEIIRMIIITSNNHC